MHVKNEAGLQFFYVDVYKIEVAMVLTIIFGVILATLLFVPQVMGTIFGLISVERAMYDVVRQVSSNTQLRRYHQCVYVETPTGNDGTSSSEESAAFQRLAQYIGAFGMPANESAMAIVMTAPVVRSGAASIGDGFARKVAMTAPVVQTSGTMAFVLPVEYKSVEAAPIPIDPQVTLRAGEARTCAVLTFGGYVTDTIVSKRVGQLRATLAKEGIEPVHAQFEVLRYNPPFTIPLLRTNEILIEVHVPDT